MFLLHTKAVSFIFIFVVSQLGILFVFSSRKSVFHRSAAPAKWPSAVGMTPDSGHGKIYLSWKALIEPQKCKIAAATTYQWKMVCDDIHISKVFGKNRSGILSAYVMAPIA